MTLGMNKKQIEKLSEGTPPWIVDENWDAEMVIITLARAWLKNQKQISDLKLQNESLQETIQDVY